MSRRSEIVTAGPVSIETYTDGDGPGVVILPSYGREGGGFGPFTGRPGRRRLPRPARPAPLNGFPAGVVIAWRSSGCGFRRWRRM